MTKGSHEATKFVDNKISKDHMLFKNINTKFTSKLIVYLLKFLWIISSYNVSNNILCYTISKQSTHVTINVKQYSKKISLVHTHSYILWSIIHKIAARKRFESQVRISFWSKEIDLLDVINHSKQWQWRLCQS